MESLQYYELITKKMLIRYNSGFATKVFKDNDLFGSFVSTVMIADHEFNTQKQLNNSLEAFRANRLKWAIKNHFRFMAKKSQIHLMDNDHIYGISDGIQYDHIVENREFLDFILNDSLLDDIEQRCIIMKYEGFTLEEIGDKINLTKQRAQQIIKSARAKLTKKYSEFV